MLKVRHFRAVDLDALYAISLATGHEGGDASHLYEDGRLIGHIYSAPYAVLEPQLSLVVEDSGGVCGFAVGVRDTKEWQERLESEWWPELRLEYPDPSTIPPSTRTADQHRAYAIHHPGQSPRHIVDLFPAHLHLNLSRRVQGRGIGSRLLSEWMARLENDGPIAVHVGVNRANTRAIRFWSKHGFDQLSLADGDPGRTVWMGRPRLPCSTDQISRSPSR